jgi:hypothetical protein
MRRILVAGNWKMNTGRAEALELAGGLVERHGEAGPVDVLIAPPFVWLGEIAEVVRGSAVACLDLQGLIETAGHRQCFYCLLALAGKAKHPAHEHACLQDLNVGFVAFGEALGCPLQLFDSLVGRAGLRHAHSAFGEG